MFVIHVYRLLHDKESSYQAQHSISCHLHAVRFCSSPCIALTERLCSGDAVACGRVTCALLRAVRAALPKPQTLTVRCGGCCCACFSITLRKQTHRIRAATGPSCALLDAGVASGGSESALAGGKLT